MSSMLSRFRDRLKGEDRFVHAVEDASKTDYVERWDAIRMARRRLFAPALFGAVGTAGMALDARDAKAQTTTPFLSWPFRSSVGGGAPNTPGNPANANTAGISSRTASDRVFSGDFSLLEFYPPRTSGGSPFTVTPGVGKSVMKNATNPISNFYSTLAAAQQDYPFLTNITDEIDWAAWQAAFLYIYNRDNGNGVGTIKVPQGIILINRTITCACSGIRIIGEGNLTYTPQIRWGGPDGTANDPNYMMLFQCATELGVPVIQLGSSIPQQQTGGGAQEIERILFQGKSGNLFGLVGNESHFISGLRVSSGGGFRVFGCRFSGTLFDGVVFTGALTFTFVEKCAISGIYRDCIAFWPQVGNFQTTMNLIGNNLANWGRYAFLVNQLGGVGVTPVVTDTIFEGQNVPSYYTVNPQHFIHGVPVSCAFVGCSQPHFSVAYLETSQTNLGFLHLADSGLGEIICQYGSEFSPSVVFSNSINVVSNTAATWTGTNLTLSGTQVGTFYPGMALVTPGSSTAPVIATITGNTTAGSAVVTGLSSTAALCQGLEATTGLPPGASSNLIQGTLIVSVDSSSQITVNIPARLTATQSILFRLPPGARIVSGTYPNFVVSPSLTIPNPIGINNSAYMPDWLLNVNTKGYTDVTDTRNLWCGGNTTQYPTSSYVAGSGGMKFSGWGTFHTVGGISLGAGANQIDRCQANLMSDYALDVVHGRAALATCQAGVIDINAGVLTVDATGNSSPFPFGAGQTIYGPGKVSQGPDRAYGKGAIGRIASQATGTTGGQGTYNMAGTQPGGGASAVQAIWAIVITPIDIDTLGTFSGVQNSIWENIWVGGSYTPTLVSNSYGRFYKQWEARLNPGDSVQELWAFGQMSIRTAVNVAPSSGTFFQGSQWWNVGAKPGSFAGWICTTQGTIGSGGVVSAVGHVIGPTTVANLPTPDAAHIGATAAVTDATVTTFGSPIGSGGGSSKVTVHCNGTNWTVMGI